MNVCLTVNESIWLSIMYVCICSYNSGIVLLLAVLSSMDGQTKTVPMSPGYSSYSYQITTTTPEYYTTTYAYPVCIPAYYTEAPKYYTDFIIPAKAPDSS